MSQGFSDAEKLNVVHEVRIC